MTTFPALTPENFAEKVLTLSKADIEALWVHAPMGAFPFDTLAGGDAVVFRYEALGGSVIYLNKLWDTYHGLPRTVY